MAFLNVSIVLTVYLFPKGDLQDLTGNLQISYAQLELKNDIRAVCILGTYGSLLEVVSDSKASYNSINILD